MLSKSYSLKTLPQNSMMVKWENLGKEYEEGNPFDCSSYSSLTIAFEGVFDGAKVRLQGSLEDEFHTVNDSQGNSITTGSPKIERVLEKVLEVKPVIEHAGTKTDVKVILLCCV